MKKQVYTYTELTDEVVDDKIDEPVIDASYKYVSHNWFYNFITFIYFRLIIFPVAFIYTKLIKRIKIVGAKKLKGVKKGGCFIYANHTLPASDAFSPPVTCFPKKPYVIVNPKNLNVPFFKKSTKMLGALPLPTGLAATKNFMAAIDYRLKHNAPIVIYPEAKIWPYYTGIRPFPSTSFKYPSQFKTPIFTMTTTYQTTKRGRRKIVIYVDGPYNIDNSLNVKEQQERFYEQAVQSLNERAKLSTFITNEFVKIEGEDNGKAGSIEAKEENN